VTDFLSQIKGGFSVHVEEDGFTGVRFCLARFGEDPDKVLASGERTAAAEISSLFRCSATEPLRAWSYARSAAWLVPCNP
jgi:hypothetical protein